MNVLLGLLRRTLPPALALSVLVSAPAHARLVYVKGESVYTARDDGSGARRLGTGLNPTLSPDGRWVAYLRGRVTRLEVRLVRASGGASRRIMRSSQVAELRWSPDSTQFGVALSDRLAVHDIPTRSTFTAASGGVRGFSFSPDSKSVVWARAARRAEYDAPTDLYTITFDAGRARRITSDRRSRNPLWTAEGIVFNKQTVGGGRTFPSYEIHEIQPDGSAERQVTNGAVAVDDLTYGLMPLARSGTRVLAALAGQSRFEPYAVDMTTGAARKLEGDNLVGASLSRDGQTVLGQTGGIDPTDPHNVVTVPWEGGAATVLLRRAQSPGWNR